MPHFTSDELFEFLVSEAEAHFSGWDFSYIEGREDQAPLRWPLLTS
jgi:hypothetical protein